MENAVKINLENEQISPEILFVEFIKNSISKSSEIDAVEKQVMLDKADFFTKGKELILSNNGGI